MRIVEAYIDGFGIFHDQKLTDIKPGINLFWGNNEAGKSTLLAFFRSVLFGFEGRQKNPFFPPLKGGRHGGRIELEAPGLSRIIVERYNGPKGGDLKLIFSDGTKGSHQDLQALFYGVNQEIYKNIYAFSLTELQTLQSLNNEQIKGVIYGAGLGAGITDVLALRKSLENVTNDLFRPRGQKQFINKKLRELDQVQKDLRQAQKEFERFEEIKKELDNLETALVDLRNTREQLRFEHNRIEGLIKYWDLWIESREIEDELKDLPEIEYFPENGLELLTHINEKLREREERLQQYLQEKKQAELRAASLVVHKNIISHKDEIRSLVQGKNVYQESLKKILVLNQNLVSLEQKLGEILSTLGAGWTKEKIKSFDLSLFTKDRCRKYGQKIASAEIELQKFEQKLNENKEELFQLERELIFLQENLKELEKNRLDCSEHDLKVLVQGFKRFQACVHDLQLKKEQIENEKNELKNILASIDVAWSEEELKTFPISQEIEQKWLEFVQEEKRIKDDLKAIENDLSWARQSLAQLGEEIESKDKELKAIQINAQSDKEIRLQKEKIAELNKLLNMKDMLEEQKKGLENFLSPSASKDKLFYSGLIFILLSCFGFILDVFFFENIILTILFWILLASGLGILGYNFGQKKIRQSQTNLTKDKISGLKTKIAEIDLKISNLAGELNVKDGVNPELLKEIDYTLGEQLVLCEQKRILIGELARVTEKQEKIREKIDILNRDREGKLQEKQAFEDRWAEFLKKLKFSSCFAVHLFSRTMDKVVRAREKLTNLQIKFKEKESLEKEIKEFLTQAKKISILKSACEKGPEALLRALDGFWEQVDQNEQIINRCLALQTQIEDKQKRKQDLEQNRDKFAHQASNAREEYDQILREWRKWLAGCGFDQDLEPQTVLEALNLLVQARDVLGQLENLQLEQNELYKRKEFFEQKVKKLAQDLGQEFHADVFANISVLVDNWQEELENSLHNLGVRQELKESLKGLELKMQTVSAEITDFKKKKDVLLIKAKAESEEDFNQRGKIFAHRQKLDHDLKQIRQQLKLGLGLNTWEEVGQAFAHEDKNELIAKFEELKREIGTMNDEESAMVEALARLKNEQEKLAGSDEVLLLKAKEESLLAQIKDGVLKWSKYRLAMHFLEQGKLKFEREQQPKVLKKAGEFFQTITDGQYVEIFAPLGENKITVRTINGEVKEPHQLSRGTAEQLYLSLRLGYLQDVAEKKRNLPIIMDDILVNFDPQRAKSALQAILQLSKSMQLLYFTCHPQVVQMIKKISASGLSGVSGVSDTDVSIFRLERGNIRRQETRA
ncbi:AAA family ATPase [Desulfovulcanus sp.]